MNRHRVIFIKVAIAALLTSSAVSWSQQAIEASLHPSGAVRISRGGTLLAVIELNAHGPSWAHAPQEGAAAKVADLPDGAGKQFTGSLAIPNTDGGAIEYTETVKPLSQGLQLEYNLTMAKAMKINGLQFSINLPVEQYAGNEVLVPQLYDDPELLGLPKEQRQGSHQLWSGQGPKIEVAKGTENAFTLEMQAATDVLIHDLRQWDNPVFEVRLPAIMQGEGRNVSAGDKFHLSVTITFAKPVQLKGP